MNEETEKSKEEVSKEGATDEQDEGDKQETNTLIDDANLAAKRMEEANKKREELLNRQEELAAKKVLGGGSEAGGEAKPKEETDKEYSDRIDKDIREGKYS